MFTGLIQQVGTLAGLHRESAGGRLVVRHTAWETPLAVGESVAVQGVCLTVTRRTKTEFTCDVLQETLARTRLGRQHPGALLNLERALRADERFGGHFVTGHVDGVGQVGSCEKAGGDRVLEIKAGADLIGGIVPKGSIAIDGVSLTVVGVRRTAFTVHLIPHTWDQTALRALKPGDPVNLETDLIGKYVLRYVSAASPNSGLSLEAVKKAGFGSEI